MIPTRRLLLLMVLGALPVAGATLIPLLAWLAAIYFVMMAAYLISDIFLTPNAHLIEVDRIHDNRLSLGAYNNITILLTNRSPRAIHFTLRDEYPYQFQSDNTFLSGTVAPYDICELRYHVRPLQRGDYQFGAITVRYRCPNFPLLHQVTYPAQAAVKVYPNVLDVRKYDLMARKGLLYEMGLRASRVVGGGTEFERLREYTTDDEFRRINWKATARRGKPIATEFETERSQHVICVIDTGRHMRPPVGDLAKLDYVINAALLLAYVAQLKGDHVGLLTFADTVGTFVAPRRGKSQFYRMLETLYNVQLYGVESDYARALSYLSVKQKRRSLIVLFTDLMTLDAAQPLMAHMARLAQHHLPLCVTINDPNVTQFANAPLHTNIDVYTRAVAEIELERRRMLLDTLNTSGVMTLDVPADALTVQVINTYLALKGKGKL